MFLKNVASQVVGAQMISASDGSAFTGAVTVSVTGDGGAQATGSVGSGACTHEGNGLHTYVPAQAETNYEYVAYTFTGTGAIPFTKHIYPLPTTGVLAPATAGRTLVVEADGVAHADVKEWLGTAAATPSVAGVPEVDVTHWIGTAAATPTVAGVPEVDITHYLGTAAQGASGRPQVDVELWLGSAPNALVSGRVDSRPGALAANVITAASMAADASAEIADAVWDEDATGHQTGGTFGQAIGDPGANTETIYDAVVTDAAGTNVAADIIAIKAETASILTDTAEIGAAGAGLTEAGGTGDHLTALATQASVNTIDSNVDSILADTGTDGVVVAAASKTGYTLSTAGLAAFFTSDSGEAYGDAVAGSVVKEIADNAGGSSLTAADIADAVWDEAQADHVGAGTFGVIASEIADILVDTAEIGAAGAGLTNINLPNQTMDIVGNITGNLSGSVGSVTGLTAADVGAIKAVTDKLDDTLEDDGGTYRFTANALEEAPTGGSAPSAADIRAEIDSNSTQLAAIVADTNELQGDWANGGRLDLILDARASQASVDDLPTNSELTTALTPIAKEATLGTPADTDLASDIANNKTAIINAQALIVAR